MVLIQDIKKPEFDVTSEHISSPKSDPKKLAVVQVQTDANYLEHVDSRLLMSELYQRGVTVRDVFGFFYELEAMSDGRTMSVEDATLAGM